MKKADIAAAVSLVHHFVDHRLVYQIAAKIALSLRMVKDFGGSMIAHCQKMAQNKHQTLKSVVFSPKFLLKSVVFWRVFILKSVYLQPEKLLKSVYWLCCTGKSARKLRRIWLRRPIKISNHIGSTSTCT